jgi:PAS domain S-box-containing protein
MLSWFFQSARSIDGGVVNRFARPVVPFAPAVSWVPLAADVPMQADGLLFGLVAILAIVAGISVGIVYRHLHSQVETTRAKQMNAEAELRMLLTITDDAVLVLDAQGIIRAANPGAEELFGRSTDDLCGGGVGEVIPQRFVIADVTRHGPASFEAFATKLGEPHVPVEVVLAPVDLVQGRTYLLLTRPKLAPAKPEIGEPVAKLCHDLNNQLTGALGNMSMLLMNCPADGTTRERATNTKRSLLKAQDLTRKMQCLAKGDEGVVLPERASTPTIVPMPPAPISQKPAMPPSGPRVLVLDDEPAICDLVATALEAMGYDVVTKEDGTAAVDACTEAFKAGQKFSLVISDLSLPGELDGKKAVARMRALDPELKAIIASGYDHDPVIQHHREHGFAGAITKPFEMGTLMRLVRDILGPDSNARKSA